jgi:non-heme chloroperoxidase
MAAGEIASYVDQYGTKDVAAIVFVDEVPSQMAPPDYKRVLAFMDRFVEDRRGNGEKFVRSFFKKPQPEDYLKRVVAASLQTPTNTAVALLVGKFAVDLTPTLKKIDKPTLIVAADNSDEYHAAQKQIAGSRLEVFDDAGHALFVDDAERFNSLLDEFLSTSHP